MSLLPERARRTGGHEQNSSHLNGASEAGTQGSLMEGGLPSKAEQTSGEF